MTGVQTCALPISTEQSIVETMTQFEKRISQIFVKEWTKEPVWVITHGLVISTLHQLSTLGSNKAPSIYDWYLIKIPCVLDDSSDNVEIPK